MEVARRTVGGVLLLAFLGVAIAGAGNAEEVVRAGHFMSMTTAGLYLAQDLGYFTEQGLTVELIQFKSLNDATPGLATGRLDVYAGGLGASMFNAIARGIPIKAVADKGQEEKGSRYKALVARKDLYEAGLLRNLAQMKGKKVAILPRGASMDFQLDIMLRSVGLSSRDVQMVFMDATTNVTALKSGAVEAAWSFEPITARIEELGLGVVIATLDKFYPDYQMGAIQYSERFAQGRRELAQRFMLAYVKGLRAYVDAWKGRIDRDRVVQVLTRYTPLKEPAAYDRVNWSPVNPDGYLKIKSIEQEQEFYLKEGLITQKVATSAIIDHSFVDHALSKIGRYRPPANNR